MAARPARTLTPLAWLTIGVTLLALSNGRRIVPAATWLGPMFMLRFLDSTHRWLGLGLVFTAGLLVWPFSWQDMIPAPGWLYFMVTTIYAAVYFLPYLAHRLLASESTGFSSSLVFPTAWVGVDLLFQRFVTPYGSWTSLAYTQLDSLALVQFASVAGSFERRARGVLRGRKSETSRSPRITSMPWGDRCSVGYSPPEEHRWPSASSWSIQLRIPREIDDAHAAASELALDRVVADSPGRSIVEVVVQNG